MRSLKLSRGLNIIGRQKCLPSFKKVIKRFRRTFMQIGVSIAIDRLINSIKEFNPNEKFEMQLTNAEMIREAAAIIANASEEEIIDALKGKRAEG